MRYLFYVVFSAMCLWSLSLQAADRLEAPKAPTPTHAKKKKLDTDGLIGPKTMNAVEPSATKEVIPDAAQSPPKRQPVALSK